MSVGVGVGVGGWMNAFKRFYWAIHTAASMCAWTPQLPQTCQNYHHCTLIFPLTQRDLSLLQIFHCSAAFIAQRHRSHAPTRVYPVLLTCRRTLPRWIRGVGCRNCGRGAPAQPSRQDVWGRKCSSCWVRRCVCLCVFVCFASFVHMML